MIEYNCTKNKLFELKKSAGVIQLRGFPTVPSSWLVLAGLFQLSPEAEGAHLREASSGGSRPAYTEGTNNQLGRKNHHLLHFN